MKRFFTSLIIAMSLLTPVLVPAFASARSASNTDACAGLQTLDASQDCTSTNGGDTTVFKVVKAVVNILSIIIGIAAVIMVIISGFKYITSGGESSAVSSAKNTLLYAIIGIVIAAFAQVIVQFILNKVTN